MEFLYSWVAEINRSHHAGFAFMTVLVMFGLGGSIACLTELIFMAAGVKEERSAVRQEKKGAKP